MQKYKRSNYLYVLPALLFIVSFVLYPVIFNFYNAFFEWEGLRQDEVTFVGFSNFLQFFQDPVTPILFKNTAIFLVVTSVVQLGLALILAYVFASGLRFSNAAKTMIFIPVVTSYVVVGASFVRLLDRAEGYIPSFFRLIGLDGIANINWLGDPNYALFTIIAISIWKWTGYDMVLYYSGLMAIPNDLTEAAMIDGANKRVIFTKIIFPSLRSTHYTCFILNCIGVFKIFDHVQVLTKGGPGRATQFFSNYIYLNATELFKQGYASAIAVVLFLITLIVTVIQLRMYSKNAN